MKYLLHGKVEIVILQWLEEGAIVHFKEKHVCVNPFFTPLNSIVLQPEEDLSE